MRPAPFIRFRKQALVAIAALLLLGAAASAAIFSGVYDVSAMRQHTAPVYWVLEVTMRYAVRRRASDITAPPLSDPEQVRRGFLLHRESCVQCHGAPGVSPHDAGKGMLPPTNNLVQTALQWSAAEIYWVTQNGLKMTGMPAWGMRYSDADLWAIVAFVKHLPRMTVADYAAMAVPGAEKVATPAQGAAAGDAGNGKLALQQYACTTCHRIPGMVGSEAHVGPPLDGIAARTYLAGRLPNSPENLVRWIRDPKSVSPATLMPDLGVTEQHARDMAAYLHLMAKGGP
jgi:mono/diheme cytochrome c family protein